MEHIVSLFLFLSFALWEDYHSKKISNLLIFTALSCAILDQIRQNGFQSILCSLFHLSVMILVLLPLYLLGSLGAGDIKLLGVTAVYLSWRLALSAFFAGVYFALFPVLLLVLKKKLCLGKRIPMSGPLVGGILFVL